MGQLPGQSGPFAGWAKRDWLAFWVCMAIGIGVTEAVGASVRPALDFWPALAVKVAAGGAAVLVAWAAWARLIRPKPCHAEHMKD